MCVYNFFSHFLPDILYIVVSKIKAFISEPTQKKNKQQERKINFNIFIKYPDRSFETVPCAASCYKIKSKLCIYTFTSSVEYNIT